MGVWFFNREYNMRLKLLKLLKLLICRCFFVLTPLTVWHVRKSFLGRMRLARCDSSFGVTPRKRSQACGLPQI